MTAPTLNLLVLYSHDADRLAAFYTQFGFIFQKHRHGAGVEHYAAEIVSEQKEVRYPFVFEIYPAKNGDAATRVRLGFRVPSVDDRIAALVADGVTVVTPTKQTEWGRRAVIADPDGNRVELTEPDYAGEDAERNAVQRGREVYEAQIRGAVEDDNRYKFIAIDGATGDYEIGDWHSDAIKALRTRHPDGVFFVRRVGAETMGRLIPNSPEPVYFLDLGNTRQPTEPDTA